MERRGVGKRLTDGQRVEIIKLFDSGAAVTEADIARRYGVSRSAIWRLRRSSSQIMERYQEGDVESRDERRRGSLGSSSRQFAMQPPAPAAGVGVASQLTQAGMSVAAATSSDESESLSVNVDALAAMTPGMTTAMLTSTTNGNSMGNNNSNMMLMGMMDQGVGLHVGSGGSGGSGMLGGNGGMVSMTAAPAARARLRAAVAPDTTASDVRGPPLPPPPSSTSVPSTGEVELTPGALSLPPEPALPLIYMSAKAISSVQSPGVLNWERLNGYDDANYFLIVNDGISVVHEGTYQINIDLEHSQPRQNYKFVFKVWNGKKLVGQCGCPLRTKKEISLSVLEMRCKLQPHARLRVEFLAAGFAFHESRIVIRLVQ